MFRQHEERTSSSGTLAHPDPEKILCLFTNAPDKHWSGVLSQIPQKDKATFYLPFEEQRHEPLSFLSRTFRNSQVNWSTADKEAFAIVESVTRLYAFTRKWLLVVHGSREFDIYF